MTANLEATSLARHSDRAIDFSIVLPVYQEGESIERVVVHVLEALGEITANGEVVVVDDGSTDATADVLLRLRKNFPRLLRVIRHPYNKGNGAAVKSGIRAARGRNIVCMDGDGQHEVRDIFEMLPLMEKYDLVVGARGREYEGVWYRNFANSFLNALASWMTEFPIKDLTSGFRVFRASVIQKYLHLFPSRFSYPTTTTLALLKGGHNVKYVAIMAKSRQGGRSKIKAVRDGWRFLIIILKIVVLFEPLRVFTRIALLAFILGAAATAYGSTSLKRLYMPNSALLLFVTGLLVFLLGMVSEQIAILQMSVRPGDSAPDGLESD